MIEFDESNWQIKLLGNNQFQNYFIPIILLFGGIGAYSYVGFLSIFSMKTIQKVGIPTFNAQTFSLLSYGSAALVLGGFLLFSVLSNIGAGLIKFEKNNQQITLAFKGYPGKNERLFFSYNFRELKSIKIVYTQSPVPRQGLFLVLEGSREIPIWSGQDVSKFPRSESFITNLGIEMNLNIEIVYNN
uniref:Photosystem I assembly protein Ycf4 n=1 Tax=Pseudellipsoidion edaphicum TaxID=1431838 RepID=A0A410D2N5_9STRA|nr:photosystem I assembly protein ycf4 [Pseudellipsoidion edaphicum]QAA11984.1 photosystem I assembly protein ycf4 [Pseudellipsoidion edaphicum]